MTITPRNYQKSGFILNGKMADGGTAEESLELADRQRKISAATQPVSVDNHNSQPQKSEAAKKSLKKKGQQRNDITFFVAELESGIGGNQHNFCETPKTTSNFLGIVITLTSKSSCEVNFPYFNRYLNFEVN